MSGAPPLEGEGLTVEFRTRYAALVALRDVPFAIAALGVVGEPGAGRSHAGAAG